MITAASEDASYGDVDQEDQLEWATAFGLTFPVVADPAAATDAVYDPSHARRPSYVLLAPGAEIVVMGAKPSDAEIEAVLPTSYP